MNKVRSKKSKGFSGRNRKCKRFFRPKTGDLQKKKGLHPKNVAKSGVSPTKTIISTSICTPEAPSLLIFSGHSPRLGGHNFRLGGHNFRLGGHKQSVGGAQPRYALRGAGSDLCTNWYCNTCSIFIIQCNNFCKVKTKLFVFKTLCTERVRCGTEK